MTCDNLRELLHAYFDGELDAGQTAACADHMRSCSECAAELDGLRSLQAALRNDSFYHRPPPGLRAGILSQLPAPRQHRGERRRFSIWLGAATLIAGGLLIALNLVMLYRSRSSADDGLAREVASAHARSLQAAHLVDEESSNRHTVKPWFQGRLDFSPPVPDLTNREFDLAGGRLDYLDDRPVAALVYRYRLHVINLFVWPVSADDSAVQATSRRGFHIVHWTHDRLTYWAISDLNAEDLQQFADAVRGDAP